MTELQVIRATIPMQYKKVQEAMIEYKRCQNLNQLIKKEKHLKELFRLIEEELKLSCKFNSVGRQGQSNEKRSG